MFSCDSFTSNADLIQVPSKQPVISSLQVDEIPDFDEDDPMYAEFKGIFERFEATKEVCFLSPEWNSI